MQFPDDGNGDMLRALMDAGIDLSQPLAIDFYLVFKTKEHAEKAMADAPETAIELMMSKTSVIKRPVVVYGVQIFVGHDETRLQSITL